MPAPRPRRISDILPKIQNVAQTSHYFVRFVLPSGDLRGFLRRKGVNARFIADDIGLLCSEAVLPGSALASIDTRGDYQGVIERFAHTRNFTQISLEFYVDLDYKVLKFFEHWIEYITGASGSDAASDTHFFQLKYPNQYKSNDCRIVKFERDYNRFLEYRFIGLFPLSINSVGVNYNGSQVLKVSASFSFDRYVCGESSSLARLLGKAFNNKSDSGFLADNGEGIPYNDANKLSQVMTGIPILNSDQFALTKISDFGDTITVTTQNKGGIPFINGGTIR